MSKIIGLTGGIATGKSTVSQMFQAEGIPVIDADKIAKELLSKNAVAYEELRETLGEDILATDGTINRNKLGKMLFEDKRIREKVNAIIHPKAINIVQSEIARLKTLNHAFIVVDIPLLFETGFESVCDITLLVVAKRQNQINRLISRDKIDEDYALLKIKAQLPLSKKRALADYIIDNSKSILETKKAFERFMRDIRKDEHDGH